ncbi:S41 family peptidase, partial [Patescibacteria group bacterium]|nr:S41 family peptidase [Patescibacteria group bacterium]
NKELNGTFEGIGTEIGIKNNLLTIIAPLPDTPAARAGLKAGDTILKIDDEETIDLRIDQAVRLIRGPKGSVVVLTVVSKGENEAREVSIVREVIKIDSVSWEMLDNNIAYIEIVHFDSNTDENFKIIANEIIVANPDGLIIDVRNNPGGFLDSVVAIAGVLLKEEVIVIEASGNERSEIKSTTSPKLGEIEIVVLVNGGSASASEILAGALQDYDRAIILGEQTFGKGSVQDFEEFRDGSSLKLTVSKWLTPKGRSINEDGITPDIEVPFTDEDYNNDLDPQLDAAVALILE